MAGGLLDRHQVSVTATAAANSHSKEASPDSPPSTLRSQYAVVVDGLTIGITRSDVDHGFERKLWKRTRVSDENKVTF